MTDAQKSRIEDAAQHLRINKYRVRDLETQIAMLSAEADAHRLKQKSLNRQFDDACAALVDVA